MNRNRIKQLLENNKGRGQFRAETSGGEATIYLYDVIVSDDSWGGVSALTFAKALNAIDADTVHLRLDSPGGDVFASISMSQAMREHKALIIVHVDGYAASAATQLLMAADKSVISKGGMVMIHKAWTFAMGNSDDFTGTAGLLNKIDGQIAESYSTKTGLTVEEAMQMMADETWMTETEAVEMGFVDAIAEPNPDKQKKNASKWDLSAYSKPPEVPEEEEPPADEEDSDNSTDDGSDGNGAVSDFDIRDKLRLHLKIVSNPQ
jgi:ATP-dependent Clp protease protease subunit